LPGRTTSSSPTTPPSPNRTLGVVGYAVAGFVAAGTHFVTRGSYEELLCTTPPVGRFARFGGEGAEACRPQPAGKGNVEP
jgi:hypothetical protein